MDKKFKPVRFPEDESAHDCIVEWWYFNGHLSDANGNRYSFMDCLFKVDVKKVKIPFLSKIPFKTSYFSHSLLSDIGRKSFSHRIAPFSIISDDSFSKPLLFANYLNPEIRNGYTNCAIEQLDASTYRVKNEDMDLMMVSTKKPLLEGGSGFLDLGSKTTYYYSLTNLKTSGRIKAGGKWIDISGKSWMDHQWADSSYSKDKWNWFSIQLDNRAELVCCAYGDGKNKTHFAGISYPDGRQEHFDDVEITPSAKKWVSRKSQAEYPLEWSIRLPEKNIDLKLKAMIKDQEMLFGSINYWEGPLSVSGLFNGKQASGSGFMELVGYDSKYSNAKYVRDEISATVQRFVSSSRSRARNFVGKLSR